MPSPRAEKQRAALSGTTAPAATARSARLAGLQNKASANAQAVRRAMSRMAATPQSNPINQSEDRA